MTDQAVESHTRFLEIATAREPLVLRDGSSVGPAVIAYETWGRLNPARDNAILVFHALSGSHHAAGFDPAGPGTPYWNSECHLGWWDGFIGPGKAFDTRKYFILCCNYLGGCYGSSGPSTTDPAAGRPFGSRFPYPSISDIVDAHLRVVDHLGIERLLAVSGGSMGGFCAMDLAARHPSRVRCVIPLASGLRATVLSKTLNFEQIFAIQEDPNFQGGDYYGGAPPSRGLTLARMISHKTFVSLSLMESRARQEIIQPDDMLTGYVLRHQIESYILHQGKKFIQRFDANSYLRIVGAWQNFDLPRDCGGGDAARALARSKGQRWLLFSIDSDVCFFPEEQEEVAAVLKRLGIDHQYITVHSEKGHDSFLLDPELFAPHIMYNLSAMHG